MTRPEFRRFISIIDIILFSALITGITLTRGIDTLYTPPAEAVVLRRAWTVTDSAGSEYISELPAYMLCRGHKDLPEGLVVFTSSFDIEKQLEHPALILPVISGNAFQVFLDGTYIGTRGDMVQGRSSVWNTSHLFNLPRSLEPGEHSLTIKTRMIYETGIITAPYLVESTALPFRSRLLIFYNNGMMYIIHGILVVLAALFIITGSLTLPEGRGKLGIGIAQLLIAFFLLDYSWIGSLPVSYLVWKKAAGSAVHCALAVLYISIKPLLGKRADPAARLLSLIEILIVFILILVPQNVPDLRRLYTIFHTTIFLFMAYMLYAGIPLLISNRRTVIIFAGTIFTLTITSHDVISLFHSKGTIFYSHIGILGFLLSTAVLIITDILEQYRSITMGKHRADSFYERSIKDPLTGAFNRTMLEMIEDDLDDNYALMLFDLDNFKSINDTRGHEAGDEVLKHLVSTIKDNIRSGDKVIRQGGDEFALILPSCTLERASEIASNINRTLSREKIESEAGHFGYDCSMGIAVHQDESLQELMRKADKKLYLQKERKKRH